MDSRRSDPLPGAAQNVGHPENRSPLPSTATEGVKIVVVGGFGVGKTTLVRSVSEIRPLSTEEVMTTAGAGVDRLPTSDKTTTTVAFDFGRISLSEEVVLYLFGAPGQERFWFLWDQLFTGTLGAVVLVDSRRLADSWYAVDRLEEFGLPFIVARNGFPGSIGDLSAVREALSLPDDVPVVDCDARERGSVKHVLITLTNHLYRLTHDREAAR